jgi:hypothetical protein
MLCPTFFHHLMIHLVTEMLDLNPPVALVRKHQMTPLKTNSLLMLCLLLTPVTALTKTMSLNINDRHYQRTSVSTSAKQHFVQFFSTINATKAEGMKNTLLKTGFPAFINVNAEQKKPHYQVHIGPFLSRDTAQQAKLKVIQHYPEHRFLSSAILKSAL